MIEREILLLFGIFFVVYGTGFDSTVCGTTKHCVSIPANCHEHSNEKCDFIFGHSPSSDGKAVEIEVYGNRKGTGGPVDYVAAGFSEDEKMGNDPVSACMVSNDGPPTLKLSYNPGPWNEPIMFTEENAKLLDSAATDEYIYCKFLQSKIISSDKFPDFDKSYQILAARGPRSPSGEIAVHNAAQSIPDPVDLTAPLPTQGQEPEEVDISDPAIGASPSGPPGPSEDSNSSTSGSEKEEIQPENSNGDNSPSDSDNKEVQSGDSNPSGSENNEIQPENPPKQATIPVQKGTGPFSLTGNTKVFLIRLHGLFMLIGWFAMVAIAIFSARYLRSAIPYSKIGGIHIWFHIHRAINVTAVVLIVIGAVIVFVGKDLEWTGPQANRPSEYNLSAGAIHSIIGLISVIIAVIQPFGSLLRCGSDHPKRPIFNWIHRSFGILAIILALITAFIAIIKFVSLWSDTTWPLVIIILYVVVAIALIAALEIYDILRIKHRQKFAVTSVELQGRGKYHQDAYEANLRAGIYERESKDKFVNLVGYILFGIASIATVTLLAIFLL